MSTRTATNCRQDVSTCVCYDVVVSFNDHPRNAVVLACVSEYVAVCGALSRCNHPTDWDSDYYSSPTHH